MALETILQSEILVNFAYPFLLIFFLVFAVLEKTNLLGDGKHQINALTSFVIGLIFVSALKPKEITGNLILFLTIAIVIVFITLLLWGFVSGSALKENILTNKAVMWIVGIILIIAVVIAVIWAAGIQTEVTDLLFKKDWSSEFWTNFIFVVIVAVALAVIIKTQK
ncbi:MAG: hypothetical protein AABW81_03865 [Nanoarchaeota archaeon]